MITGRAVRWWPVLVPPSGHSQCRRQGLPVVVVVGVKMKVGIGALCSVETEGAEPAIT